MDGRCGSGNGFTGHDLEIACATGVRRAVLRFWRARVERATVGQASCFVVQEEVRAQPRKPARGPCRRSDREGPPRTAICSRIPMAHPPGNATVSLELMPTVRSPSAASTISRQSPDMAHIRTKWLQTTDPLDGRHRHTPADPGADHRCRACGLGHRGAEGNHGGFKSHIFRLSMIGACDPLDGDGDSRFAAGPVEISRRT